MWITRKAVRKKLSVRYGGMLTQGDTDNLLRESSSLWQLDHSCSFWHLVGGEACPVIHKAKCSAMGSDPCVPTSPLHCPVQPGSFSQKLEGVQSRRWLSYMLDKGLNFPQRITGLRSHSSRPPGACCIDRLGCLSSCLTLFSSEKLPGFILSIFLDKDL